MGQGAIFPGGLFRLRRRFHEILLICLLAVPLAACGVRRPPATELVVALEANPNNFDPRFARDIYSDNVNKLVYDGLVRTGRTGEVIPRLAESWTAENPAAWRFILREGVTFHDGRPFTARDVAYTFDSIRAADSLSPLRGTFEVIDRTEVISDREIRFVLKRPSAPFLSDLTVGIVPEGSVTETLRGKPVGTGPYRFVEYVPSERVHLEASGMNWPEPGVKTVTLPVVPNETSRVLGLLHGSIDVAVNNITPLYADYLRRHGFAVLSEPGTNYTYLAFNLRDPALSKLAVRQAFAHAIRRDRLVKYRLRGMATVATGYLPPFHWAYRRPEADYGFDPEKARRLLAEAGYPGGLDVEWKTSTNKEALRNIEVMREDLEQAGIRVMVKSYEWATLFEQIVKGQFQVFTLSWVGIADPDMMYPVFHSRETPENGGRNRGYYSSPEVDRLLEAARAETDAARRGELYGEVQEITARDLPYVPLFWRDNIVVHRPGITGVEVDPSGSFWFVEKVRKSP